jgi:HEAT repeat protein
MTIRQSRVCSIVFAGALAVGAPALAQPTGAKEPVPAKPRIAEAPPDDVQEIRQGALKATEAARQLKSELAGLEGLKIAGETFGAMKLEGLGALEGLSALKELGGIEGISGLKGLAALEGFGDMKFGRSSGDRFESAQDRQAEMEQREREREIRVYEQGREFMDQGRYDRAIDRFTDVVAMKGTRADAALYFKAWSQNRSGQRAEALATISALAKEYPKSRYVAQLKALEAEVRRDSGQPVRPDSESDDDLKLMAINALVNADSEQAIPMLEKLLEGTASPKLKSRALFVLAQSSSPRAREVLKGIARGNSTPELQSRAVDYLGQHGGPESRAALAEIYAGSSDVDLKRRILRAFMVGGEKNRLLTAAQTEQNPELRGEAVQQLGVMGAHEELWQLYQKETAVDIKKRIIQAMFVGGNTTRLIELAKGERDTELRRTAVRNLGVMDSKRTSDALVEIYNTDKDPGIRKTVINGLFQQNNATALVALARKEQDPELKREIVQKLSVMGRNPVATAYMMELLNGK